MLFILLSRYQPGFRRCVPGRLLLRCQVLRSHRHSSPTTTSPFIPSCKIIFCWCFEVSDENSRIQSRTGAVSQRYRIIRIRGSGSVPKCHGSATLPGTETCFTKIFSFFVRNIVILEMSKGLNVCTTVFSNCLKITAKSQLFRYTRCRYMFLVFFCSRPSPNRSSFPEKKPNWLLLLITIVCCRLVGTIYVCGGFYMKKSLSIAIWQTAVAWFTNIRRTDPDPQHWYRFHWFSIRSGSRKVKIGTIYRMCGGLFHRVPEWQRPLSGVHSIMRVKLAEAGGVGGARPPRFTTFTITSKVYAPAGWADTLTLFHLYQYVLCGLF